MTKSLGLPRQHCTIPIGGLNDSSTASMSIVTATVKSRTKKYQRTLSFYTVPSVTRLVPNQPLSRPAFQIPKNLQLADPEFHLPAPVDMLLGSGPTLSILCVGQLDLSSKDSPDLILQKTQLGWVIGGSPPASKSPPQQQRCFVTTDIHFDLSKFWEIEEAQTIKHLTDDEATCEDHFKSHVTLAPNGRYSVALPFNAKISQLGESKHQARKRLNSIERKLNLNPELQAQYHAVLQEYIDLGHMSAIKEDNTTAKGFYLPHHAVRKNTVALRLPCGWSSMARQGAAQVSRSMRPFSLAQQFSEEQVYELNTVTFGLTPAPYLAIRCLHQLAEDEEHDFPKASKILRKDSYVDDALTGADNIEEIIAIRTQLTALLKQGKLKIRQWASNAPEALRGLPEESINRQLLLGENPTIKTLGIKWNSSTDAIMSTVKPITAPARVTKRTILSETAKIFDPLGLLALVITTAKILIQQLWILKLDWDESLPISVHTRWLEFHNQLQLLNEINFSRKIIIGNPSSVELHGFCDASERAYGACIYLRSTNGKGEVLTALVCSKSRVAPVNTITIPRLELCGALLLANLANNVINSLQIELDRVVYWTDSTIVLYWLKKSLQSLKTFVANRVAEIQSKTRHADWRHVRTHDNPADLVSRGQLPEGFVKPSHEHRGPSWLCQKEESWPIPVMETLDESALETRSIQCFYVAPADFTILERYSSIHKLETIIAYCRRFLKRNRQKGPITITELHAVSQTIVRLVQQSAFTEEIHTIKMKKPLNRQSRLLSLNPIIDDDGILRVGGRLKNSLLPFSQRHPIIIPKGHHVTRLLIEAEHRTNLHAGIQATLYALRRRSWILDGRSEVRKILRTCITCCKLQPPSMDYLMGDLPAARVTQARPFSKVGIDYCGPFFVKEKKLGNRNKVKVYVAIFVCLSVKAVHLEIVSDLSTDAFLAALRQFIARRGICSDIYSDNGTNFIGANNDQKELHEMLKNPQRQQKIDSFTKAHRINWHFIPARAPNFGGLWEAAVKSFKHHLRRVVGTNLFTYEEFNTFAIGIEAVLNSRPLTPISSDPNDLLVLTPGHFLIGDSLTSLPERELRDIATNRLSSWQHIQQVRQHFWSRWSCEYLNELTVRHKWTKGNPTIKEGTVVLLKEDNLPPLQWVMGRVTKLHPGPDRITRVVTVKTSRSSFDRSVKKIAPLPIQTDDTTVTAIN